MLLALLDGVAEVEADPDAGIDDLVLDVGDVRVRAGGAEARAAAGGAGMVRSGSVRKPRGLL